MSGRGGEIRRIVVALDASADSLAALRAAARLAAGLSTELHGLFVEDANLVRLAHLPFACEVRLSAAPRRLESEAVERQLRCLAAEARRALEREARAHRVACTFRVARGQVAREVAAAAGEGDLLILGRVSRPLFPGRLLGSTARSAATSAVSSVLLLPQFGVLGEPVTAIVDDSPMGRRVAALATRLARLQGTGVIFFRSGEGVGGEEEAVVSAVAMEVECTVRAVAGTGYSAVVAAVEAAGGGLLVVGAANPLVPEEELPLLLAALSCPLLVVR